MKEIKFIGLININNLRYKFRAWCKREKILIYSEKIGNEAFWCHFDSGTYFDVMQYTGIKNRDDVEIYEGDIVEAPHDFGPGGFALRIFEVKWNNERGGYQWEYWQMDKAKVIGNIYENPEMLEVNDDNTNT